MNHKITTTVLMLIATSVLLGGVLGLGQDSAAASTHDAVAKAIPQAIGFDFEDGTTQGWSIISHSINGSISLANSTQQAYQGTHALALDTMDYNFGSSQATIGSTSLVAGSPITAYLYMISDDSGEPYPGSVYAQLKLTDSNGQVFSGTNTRLYHQQWVMANLSFPNNATAPYTMSVALSYSNVRPTHRTVWLDYVQWSDVPSATPTPVPPTSTASPTPTPTCHPYICEPLTVNLSYANVTTQTVDLYALANFDIGTYTFYRSTDGVNFSGVGSVQGHYGNFTDTALACNTTYYYYAHAQEYGWGQRQANSNTVMLTTANCGGATVTPTSTPAIVTPTITPTCDPYLCGPLNVSLKAMVVDTMSVQLYAQANFDIGTYTLFRSVDGTNFSLVDTAQGHYGYLDDSGLNCSTSYYYYARAVEYGGYQRSGNSPTITVTTLPCGTSTPTSTPTSQPSATPTLCAHPFTDINGNVFYNAIVSLYCRGVINGMDSTHFGPAGQATRAQFAKIVVLGFAFPLITPSSGPTFTDVPSSYFAYTYIESGYARGILTGFDPASCAAAGVASPCYLPNRNITRAQVTKLVVLAANWPLLTPASGQPSFSDVPSTHWAFSYVETAYANPNGIRGYPDNTFRPSLNIRRDEMAQIVYRASSAPLG